MAQAIVTIKIMPDGVEADLNKVEEEAKKLIAQFAGEGEMKTEQTPVAFGLKSLDLTFVMDESLGSTDELEKNLGSIKGVGSVEVTDVRRAIG